MVNECDQSKRLTCDTCEERLTMYRLIVTRNAHEINTYMTGELLKVGWSSFWTVWNRANKHHI